MKHLTFLFVGTLTITYAMDQPLLKIINKHTSDIEVQYEPQLVLESSQYSRNSSVVCRVTAKVNPHVTVTLKYPLYAPFLTLKADGYTECKIPIVKFKQPIIIHKKENKIIVMQENQTIATLKRKVESDLFDGDDAQKMSKENNDDICCMQ